MVLEKQPFRKMNLEDNKQDIVNVYLNQEEREALNKAKKILEQTKDSTALKQLALVGCANLIVEQKTAVILGIVFGNKRKNKRLGIAEFE